MNGIIVVNKESGYTSRDIVNIIFHTLHTRKVGHTGTLDPLAKGVIVVCVGKALKVCNILTNHNKEYLAEVTLGIETNTLDLEGEVIKREVVNIPNEEIIKVVNSFNGSYLQEVPLFSAVKVNGRKLYDYARSSVKYDIELPKRMVDIKKIEVVGDIQHNKGLIKFLIRTEVSKGTYIRSLVRDIGRKLNVPVVMSDLTRTRVGKFKIEDAMSIDNIRKGEINLIPITEALPEIKKLYVDKETTFKVNNGVALNKFSDAEMKFILDDEGNLLALYKNDGDKARINQKF